MPTPHPRQIRQSAKLLNVRYDVRGPILEEAQRMEAAGHRLMKLNIGNPAPFGFEAPDAILQAMYRHLPHAQGYSDSQGIYSARTAVSQYYESRGIRDIGVEDVFIGNGVSEMISMVLQALVDDGDEVLAAHVEGDLAAVDDDVPEGVLDARLPVGFDLHFDAARAISRELTNRTADHSSFPCAIVNEMYYLRVQLCMQKPACH